MEGRCCWVWVQALWASLAALGCLWALKDLWSTHCSSQMFPSTITLSGAAAWVSFDGRSCRKILAEEPFLEVILGTLLHELGYGFNYFYICDLQPCLPCQHYLTGRPQLGSVESFLCTICQHIVAFKWCHLTSEGPKQKQVVANKVVEGSKARMCCKKLNIKSYQAV